MMKLKNRVENFMPSDLPVGKYHHREAKAMCGNLKEKIFKDAQKFD